MRKLVLILTLAVAVIGLLPVQGAMASEGTLVANTSSAWQTNGVVWSLAYARGAVYLGGDFTSVRPPGAASGVGEVARNHIAAFSASTGELLPFSHDVGARVSDIALHRMVAASTSAATSPPSTASPDPGWPGSTPATVRS